MPQEINFLAREQQVVQSRSQVDRKATIYMVILVLIITLVYGVAWYFNSSYRQQLASVQRQIDNTRQSLEQNSSQEREFLIFHEKYSKLARLMSQRKGGVEALVDTYSYFLTPDTSVLSSTYDYYSHILDLELTCNSVFSLTRLMNLVHDPEFSARYRSLELVDLSRQANGTYKLEISLEV
ncbi:hypothetical protein IJJ27_02250 [bacterium]|nr:hypothetical protein [bacterium]MBQ6436363.1 hypothetical protein [bacterium]